ncbi:hypothetical protein GCM10009087_22690 [Sphingomonas oligophenolica]|uniref:Lipoprotein n=1 Tax=Sphingomonas oligophenolica TaxID=301154 RepID=A0ABU9Y1P7_9SPHN
MRHLAAFSLLLVAGCSSGTVVPANTSVDINAAAVEAQGSVDAYAANSAVDNTMPVSAPTPVPASSPPPLTPPAPGTPGGLPDDRSPVSEAPFTADSAQGAADVVQHYYALLTEGKYSQARLLWADDGKASGSDAAGFAARFAKYSEYHANIGAPGDVDAGAGQRYVTVPVQVYARLKQGGGGEYQIGSVTLHRTADIDGAAAAQKSWHIRSIDLKPAPAKP